MNVSDAAAGAASSATPALDEGGESASGANAALLALGGVPAEPLVVYVLAFAAVVTALGRTVDVPFYSTELTAATLSAAHLRF